VDHIRPLVAGGTGARENLQALCHWCHQAKSAIGMADEISVLGQYQTWPVDPLVLAAVERRLTTARLQDKVQIALIRRWGRCEIQPPDGPRCSTPEGRGRFSLGGRAAAVYGPAELLALERAGRLAPMLRALADDPIFIAACERHLLPDAEPIWRAGQRYPGVYLTSERRAAIAARGAPPRVHAGPPEHEEPPVPALLAELEDTGGYRGDHQTLLTRLQERDLGERLGWPETATTLAAIVRRRRADLAAAGWVVTYPRSRVIEIRPAGAGAGLQPID